MNYGELKTMLEGYLHRSDLADMIPSFVLLAQARLNKDIKHLVMEEAADLTTTAGSALVALPEGVLHLSLVRVPDEVAGGTTLDQMTLDQWAGVKERVRGAEGVPTHYAILSPSAILVAPVPEEAITISIIYRKGATAFTADEGTDTLLTTFPGAYLYACMIEAAMYTNSDKRVAIWKGLYDTAIADIADADFEARWSDSAKSISSPTADTP